MTHTNWIIFNFVLLIADIFGYAVSYLLVRRFKKRLLRYPTFHRLIWWPKKPTNVIGNVCCAKKTIHFSFFNVVKLHSLKIIFPFLLSYRYFHNSLATKKKFQKDVLPTTIKTKPISTEAHSKGYVIEYHSIFVKFDEPILLVNNKSKKKTAICASPYSSKISHSYCKD